MPLSYEREFDCLHVGEFRPQRAWCPRSGRYVTVMAAPIIATRIVPVQDPDAAIAQERGLCLDDSTNDMAKLHSTHRGREQRIAKLTRMLSNNGPMRIQDAAQSLHVHPDTLRRDEPFSRGFKSLRAYRFVWLLLPHHTLDDIPGELSPNSAQGRLIQALRTENREMTTAELAAKTGLSTKSVHAALKHCRHVVARKDKLMLNNSQYTVCLFRLRE